MTNTFEIKNKSCYTILIKWWGKTYYHSTVLKQGEIATLERGNIYLISGCASLDPIYVLGSSNTTKYKRICIRVGFEKLTRLPRPFVSWSECE